MQEVNRDRIEKIQKKIHEIAQKSYREKLMAGTSGNTSLYDRELKLMGITPSNVDYGKMKWEDIVMITLEGDIVQGALKPSSEWRMHAEIYKNMPRVNAVIHTHSPRATGFAVVHETIPLILVEMIPFLGGDIPLADFELPGTKALGLSVSKAMTHRNACLMTNHGVVAIGENVDQAYIRAVYVEDAATIYHFARQLGEPKMVPKDAVSTMKAKYGLVD